MRRKSVINGSTAELGMGAAFSGINSMNDPHVMDYMTSDRT